MSVRMPNVLSTASLMVLVRCPSSWLDVPPQNPESTVRLHREFLGDGDGWVPSGSRIPSPLVQVMHLVEMIGPHCPRLCRCLRWLRRLRRRLVRMFPMCPRVHRFFQLLRRIQRLLVLVPRCPQLRKLLGGCVVSCAAARDGGSSASPLCGSPCDCFVRPGVGGGGG